MYRQFLFGNGVVAVAMSKSDGFAGSLAEVIQLRPPCFAASDGPDIDNIW